LKGERALMGMEEEWRLDGEMFGRVHDGNKRADGLDESVDV